MATCANRRPEPGDRGGQSHSLNDAPGESRNNQSVEWQMILHACSCSRSRQTLGHFLYVAELFFFRSRSRQTSGAPSKTPPQHDAAVQRRCAGDLSAFSLQPPASAERLSSIPRQCVLTASPPVDRLRQTPFQCDSRPVKCVRRRRFAWRLRAQKRSPSLGHVEKASPDRAG